jgi:cell division protein FtsB
MRSKTLISVLFCLFGIMVGNGFGSIESLQQDIAAKKAEITKIQDEEVAPKQKEINDLKAAITAEQTKIMDYFNAKDQIFRNSLSAQNLQLRKLNERIFNMQNGHLQFYEAKETWENSSDPEVRKEMVTKMFRFIYGFSRDPGSELRPENQDEFVTLAYTIMRGRTAALVGKALVLLGDTTLKIFSVASNPAEAVANIVFTVWEGTLNVLPDAAIKKIYDYGGKYLPSTSLQKEMAEALANDLDKLNKSGEEITTEKKQEILQKSIALRDKTQQAIAILKSEISAMATVKQDADNRFAAKQGEINDKYKELDTIKQKVYDCYQQLANLEFQLQKEVYAKAIADNGGATNYIESISLSLSGQIISLDKNTDAFTAYKTSAAVSVKVNYVTLKQQEVSWQEKIGEDSEGKPIYITKKETYNVLHRFSAVQSAPTINITNVSGEATYSNGLITGVKAGHVTVTASGSPKYDGYDTVQQSHSTSYTIKGGGEIATAAQDINIWEASSIVCAPYFLYEYVYRNLPTDSTAETKMTELQKAVNAHGAVVDLFVDINDSGSSTYVFNSFIHYLMTRFDGNTLLEGKAFDSRGTFDKLLIEGDVNCFEIKDNKSIKAIKPGSITLKPSEFTQDTTLVSFDNLTINANTIEPQYVASVAAETVNESTTPEPGLRPLYIGDTHNFKLNISGSMTKSNYTVKWIPCFVRYSNNYETETPITELTSNNPSSLTNSLSVVLTNYEDFNKIFRVKFEIYRKVDNKLVYSGKTEDFSTNIKVKRFLLFDEKAEKEFTNRIFYPFRGVKSYSPNLGSFSLKFKGDLGDGKYVTLPLADKLINSFMWGADSFKASDIGFASGYTDYYHVYLSTVDSSGRGEIGHFELDSEDVNGLRNMGIVLEETKYQSLALVDVNILKARWTDSLSKPEILDYILKIAGPTNLDQFKVRFTFTDGTTVDQPIHTVGSFKEGRVEANKVLQQVQLINPTGNPAATLDYLANFPFTRQISSYYNAVYKFISDNGSYKFSPDMISICEKVGLQRHMRFSFPEDSTLADTHIENINYINFPKLVSPAMTEQATAWQLDFSIKDTSIRSTFAIASAPKTGSATISTTKQIQYTVSKTFKGIDQFEVLITDPTNDFKSGIGYKLVQVTISCAGDKPKIIFDIELSYCKGSIGETMISLADSNGLFLIPTIITAPTIGTASIMNSSFIAYESPTTLSADDISGQMKVGFSNGKDAEIGIDICQHYRTISAGSDGTYSFLPTFFNQLFYSTFQKDIQKLKFTYISSNAEVWLGTSKVEFDQEISSQDFGNLTLKLVNNEKTYFYAHVKGFDGSTWSDKNQYFYGYTSDVQNNALTAVINAVAGDNGTITPAGQTIVPIGSDQAYTITANSGYKISDVLVDGTSVGAVSSYTFQQVTANHTISASFARNTANVLFSVKPAGTGTTSPAPGLHEKVLGESFAIKATPQPGYRFLGWEATNASIDAIGSATTNATISGSSEIAAVFIADNDGDGDDDDSGDDDDDDDDGGTTPSIALTYPNGGDVFQANQTVSITWLSLANLSSVKIELVKDDVSATTIIESTPDTGSYDWTIPAEQPLSNFYKIRITGTEAANSSRIATNLTDVSDSYFSVVGDKYLVLTSPNGGEIYQRETTQTITWQSSGFESNVKIELYYKGTYELTIIESTENTGSFDFTTPSTQNGSDYSIKISSVEDNTIYDFSNNNFSIIGETSLTLTMAVFPDSTGTCDPATGEHSVDAGIPYDIEATPATGYKFARWQTGSTNLVIAEPTSASSSIVMYGSAELTAIFAIDESTDEDINDFDKVFIRLNGSKENADSATIIKGDIPESIAEADLDPENFTISLLIDNYKLDLTEETGELKKKSSNTRTLYTYQANKDQTKVNLLICLDSQPDETDEADETNETEEDEVNSLLDKTAEEEDQPIQKKKKKVRYWSCKVSKVDLSNELDSTNGIDIYLTINDKVFGNNISMIEQTKWNFKQANDASNVSILKVDGTPMAEFDILQTGCSLFFDELAEEIVMKDNFMIKKATLDELTFDPTTDHAAITIDDWSFDFDDEEAWSMKKETKATYKTKTEDGELILLVLDFAKKRWSFRINKTNFSSDVDYNDGIDVKLKLGNNEAGLRLFGTKTTTLKY